MEKREESLAKCQLALATNAQISLARGSHMAQVNMGSRKYDSPQGATVHLCE